MKKLTSLLSLFAIMLFVAANANAQTTINASAEVRADLTITEVQDIDFGLILQDFGGGNPDIDPSDGTTTNIQDATNAHVGFVSVSGTADQTVDITVDTDITLTDGTDNITLTPEYNWTRDNLTAGAGSWTANGTNTGANFSMTLDGAANNDDGQNTILIGGALTESKVGDLNAGTYSGTGSITVSYQ